MQLHHCHEPLPHASLTGTRPPDSIDTQLVRFLMSTVHFSYRIQENGCDGPPLASHRDWAVEGLRRGVHS